MKKILFLLFVVIFSQTIVAQIIMPSIKYNTIEHDLGFEFGSDFDVIPLECGLNNRYVKNHLGINLGLHLLPGKEDGDPEYVQPAVLLGLVFDKFVFETGFARSFAVTRHGETHNDFITRAMFRVGNDGFKWGLGLKYYYTFGDDFYKTYSSSKLINNFCLFTTFEFGSLNKEETKKTKKNRKIFNSLNNNFYMTSGSNIERTKVLSYSKDNGGIYQLEKDSTMKYSIPNNASVYAYDKKHKTVYYYDKEANYKVKLDKERANLMKKRFVKDITYSKKELVKKIEQINTKIKDNVEDFNIQRRKFIEDSIRNEFIKDSLAKEKIKQDSIAREQRIRDSIQVAENNRKIYETMLENYKDSHRHSAMSTKSVGLYCSDCGKTIYEDTIFVFKVDTLQLFYFTKEYGAIGISKQKLHKILRTDSQLEKTDFKIHYDAFRDSIFSTEILDEDWFQAGNDLCLSNFRKNLMKKAPYGYIEEYTWDDDFSVTFSIEYVNLNKKTIKYLDTYWTIYNAVGDVRGSGHFKGTGPVVFGETGYWKWKHSSYHVAGDATKMKITKIIITYMDGTQKILNKKDIIIDR